MDELWYLMEMDKIVDEHGREGNVHGSERRGQPDRPESHTTEDRLNGRSARELWSFDVGAQ